MTDIWNGVVERAFTFHWSMDLPAVALLTALAGFVVLLPKIWPRARFIVTFVHESGHALASLLTGGGLKGMKIHGDSSGVTETWREKGLIGWLSSQCSTWAGYPAPAFLAILLTVSANVGLSSFVVLLLAVGFIVSILFMRNLRGLGLALLFGSTTAAIFWLLPTIWHSVIVLLLAGVLIAGGTRTVIELQIHHRQGDRSESDVAALAHSFKPMELFIFTSYYLVYAATVASIGYIAWFLSQQ